VEPVSWLAGYCESVAPSHSFSEQWLRATGKTPLTVAGQRRLFTDFPNIPPVCLKNSFEGDNYINNVE
jgi:hypothetical protein